MVDNATNNQNTTGIEYTSKHKWGYDPDQVDAFLEHAHELYDRGGDELTQQDIQSSAFAFSKGGYVIAEVDAALARLEHAVVDRQTARQIANNGRVAWKAETDRLYQLVRDHASRTPKERFARALSKHPSYDVKQVDQLIDQVVVRTSDDLGIKTMTPGEAKDLANFNSSTVSNAIFTQRKGKKGYDERQVDYYFDSCVQLLSRIESYQRLANYEAAKGTPQAPLSDDAGSVAAAQPAAAQPAAQTTSSVSPLFTDTAAATAPVAAAAPVVPTLPNEATSTYAAPATSADAAAGSKDAGNSSLAALASQGAPDSAVPSSELPTTTFAAQPEAPATGKDDMGIPDLSFKGFDAKPGHDASEQ
ncbi:DivIVA domain-containing protein [Bifidobacterium sp. ESL0763]|uniref:DivIVA domain-containing protein n=1 Tax=Bifidobacterium sp. ESL0763 TaxID=2983227 RepID=UPI0023F6450A|nr:DivIVA domain-containing protein [Bifidobacterium sp. ESL0763]MDF7664195.1 DivIVA domain-containing protein [Bifidobacterium sp. ESL0763]